MGTVNVLEAASLTGVERVVFTSSVSYGRVTEPENLHPVYTPVTEDHYPNPDSVYDVTKSPARSWDLLTDAHTGSSSFPYGSRTFMDRETRQARQGLAA